MDGGLGNGEEDVKSGSSGPHKPVPYFPVRGQIQNLRFCDGRNLGDIISCPEFPVVI